MHEKDLQVLCFQIAKLQFFSIPKTIFATALDVFRVTNSKPLKGDS